LVILVPKFYRDNNITELTKNPSRRTCFCRGKRLLFSHDPGQGGIELKNAGPLLKEINPILM